MGRYKRLGGKANLVKGSVITGELALPAGELLLPAGEIVLPAGDLAVA